MKRKLALWFMIIGVALVIGAAGLIYYNNQQDATASEEALKTAERVRGVIEARLSNSTAGEDETTAAGEIIIDGNTYIGLLSIPALSLTLPVMDNWSYAKLKISPCRYMGSIANNNLVILAHNYSRHFGNIHLLQNGETVAFTDAEGAEYSYSVAMIETIDPTDARQVVESGYDLTLFTCTYGGSARVAIHCMRNEE